MKLVYFTIVIMFQTAIKQSYNLKKQNIVDKKSKALKVYYCKLAFSEPYICTDF